MKTLIGKRYTSYSYDVFGSNEYAWLNWQENQNHYNYQYAYNRLNKNREFILVVLYLMAIFPIYSETFDWLGDYTQFMPSESDNYNHNNFIDDVVNYDGNIIDLQNSNTLSGEGFGGVSMSGSYITLYTIAPLDQHDAFIGSPVVPVNHLFSSHGISDFNKVSIANSQYVVFNGNANLVTPSNNQPATNNQLFNANNDQNLFTDPNNNLDDKIVDDKSNDQIFDNNGDDQVVDDKDDDQIVDDNGDEDIGTDAPSDHNGDDIYYVYDGTEIIIEFENGGHDLVISEIPYQLGDNVEDLYLNENALYGYGNELNNLMTLSTPYDGALYGLAGDDTLIGGVGRDFLDGGVGADKMFGGTGDDLYYVDDNNDIVFEKQNEGRDIVASHINYTLGANVEDLYLFENASIGYGNELNNQLTLTTPYGGALYGLEGDDTLIGGIGNDRLDGGVGADTMIGFAGDDSYYVDNADDIVQENANEGIDSVYAKVSFILADNIENLYLSGNGIYGIGNDLNNYMELQLSELFTGALYGMGGDDTLIGSDSSDRLDGGEGADFMQGNGGDDTYYVDDIHDIVFEKQGEGRDTVVSTIDYTLGDNVEDLYLDGNASYGYGNELNNHMTLNNAAGGTLYGLAGDDILVGGQGDDKLDGGVGADQMVGYGGDDWYYVDNINDEVLEYKNQGHDSIISSISYKLSSNIEDLYLGENATYGVGNNLNNYMILTTINGGELHGLGGDDTLVGGDGNDRLVGGDGNDTLVGGIGADKMLGNTGDDKYFVDNIDDVVSENQDEGNDTVISSINYTLGDNVENLYLNESAAFGRGNELNNHMALTNTVGGTLYGLGGDDTLIGSVGNDMLDGGVGADTMQGGAGNDSYYVDSANDSVIEFVDEGIDTVISSISYTLGANVENLVLLEGVVNGETESIDGTGNELNNTIIGNDIRNILDGGAGDDILYGNGGEDVLKGGSGNDTMYGGMGNDAYYVDSADDIIVEYAGEGRHDAVVSSASHYTLAENVESLKLADGAGAINATGNALNNLLQGNESDNILDGGAGDDRMMGFAGNDTYYVDSDGDYVFEDAGEGIDLVNSSISYTLTDDNEIENLTLTGNNAIDGIGNALNNIITGNEANNFLYGQDGDDTLIGGGGDDTLLGGSGDDTLRGGTGNDSLNGSLGNDTMEGGAGNDTYYVDNIGDIVNEVTEGSDGIDTVHATISYTLGDNVENLTLGETENQHINGTGNDLDNIITGNSDNNILDGGAGNDKLIGGAGDDILIGGAGDDKLYGGDGNDLLIGGEGNDELVGGKGSDIFSFENKSGNDYINDFVHGMDKIDFSAFNFSVTDKYSFDMFMASHSKMIDGSLVIQLDDDTSVTLKGKTADYLTLDDFIFNSNHPSNVGLEGGLGVSDELPDLSAINNMIKEHIDATNIGEKGLGEALGENIHISSDSDIWA